jgi:hypothetical protein
LAVILIMMSRLRGLALAASLALAGCSGTSTRLTDAEGDPSGDKRLQEMLRISDPAPAKWSPVVTVPLSPVLFAADTSIKFVDLTGHWIADQVRFVAALFGGSPSAPPPEAVDRAAENLQHK